jgi:hypothetical protein
MEHPKLKDYGLNASKVTRLKSLENLAEEAPHMVAIIGGILSIGWALYEIDVGLPTSVFGWIAAPFLVIFSGSVIFIMGSLSTMMLTLILGSPIYWALGLGEKSNYSRYKRNLKYFDKDKERRRRRILDNASAITSKLGTLLSESKTMFISRSLIPNGMEEIDQAFKVLIAEAISDESELEKLRLGYVTLVPSIIDDEINKQFQIVKILEEQSNAGDEAATEALVGYLTKFDQTQILKDSLEKTEATVKRFEEMLADACGEENQGL